jgi:hypothetical protein
VQDATWVKGRITKVTNLVQKFEARVLWLDAAEPVEALREQLAPQPVVRALWGIDPTFAWLEKMRRYMFQHEETP